MIGQWDGSGATPRTSRSSWRRSSPTSIPSTVRFTDLHRWVTELPEFDDDPKGSSEGKLEAIQMAWLEEYRANRD